MSKVSFESDYIKGAHPAILDALIKTNMEALSGYGLDRYTASAKDKIIRACGNPNAAVEFLVGGTQTNALIIGLMLKDYEGVISAQTGHVNTHEAGAIEYGGHKVLEIPQYYGKIKADDLSSYVEGFYNDDNHEHAVFPGMVYISHPTEYGTLYTIDELKAISAVCRNYRIPLYMDGARLGYGLMSTTSDETAAAYPSLQDIAEFCDIFYIGGTKVGALCGEAVVFTKNNRPKHFMNSVKKRGALLAKGRLTGVQFDTLFTDNLYFEISAHAITMAKELVRILKKHNLNFYLETPTNQQFLILEDNYMKSLSEKIGISFWEKYDAGHTVIRLATSWSTTKEDLEYLDHVLGELS